MKSLRVVTLIAATAGAVAVPSAHADNSFRNSPFHRCVNAALAAKPGEVLEVEQKNRNGKQVYEVDIRGKDGQKWELKCDMATTKIIKVEIDDDDD